MNLKKIINETFFKRLIKNSGILLSGNFVTSIIGLLSIMITTRALGVKDFGILVLISSYIIVIDRLVNFQSWQALIKFGAEYVTNKDFNELKGLVKVSSLLDGASALTGSIIAYLLAPVIGLILGWESQIIEYCQLYSIVILFNLTGMPTGILRLFDRFSLFAIQAVIGAIIKLVAVLIAWIYTSNLTIFIYIWIVTDIIRHMITYYLSLRVMHDNNLNGWWNSNAKNWKKPLKFTFWTNITSTFDLPVQKFDLIIISAIISIEATGVYKLIKQIGQIVTKIADPVYQAIFPDYANLVSENKFNEALNHTFKVSLVLFIISLPIISILISVSDIWFPLMFGESYSTNIKELNFYLIVLLLTVTFVTVHPLFIAIGYVKKNAMITLLSNVVFLVSAYLLGVKFGIFGIIGALMIQVVINITMKLFYIFKHKKANLIKSF